MKLRIAAAITALGFATPCLASDNIDNLSALAQSQFKSLSKDLGAALSYKPVSPAWRSPAPN